jgi:hypothetical protein
MADCKFSCGSSSAPRENVCIETGRILDSCRDRDCFENVRVFLTDLGQDIIERTTQVRVKDACIAWTYIGIDPVQFNRGFYTVHIRFYVKLIFEACLHGGHSQEFDGIAVLEKQVVLFGGDSSVSIFRSSADGSAFCAEPEPCYKERSVPTAVVEAVEPIVLGVRVLEPACHEPVCCCCCACDVPHSIAGCLSAPLHGCGHAHDTCHEGCHDGGHGGRDDDGRVLAVSLGIFSLVRLVRPAQYLISAADFIIPDKECVSGGPDNPCDLFRSMAFPVAEFSPAPMPLPVADRNKCGCNG